VLIVSNDEYNELPRPMPWALSVERATPTTPGFVVTLGPHDPLAGAASILMSTRGFAKIRGYRYELLTI
jgi:hypothetical protein